MSAEDNLVLNPKTLPPPSLTLLTRPELDPDYVHFENALDVPFEGEATTFSPRNAWWLADCALLSYWPEPSARLRFHDSGRFQDSSLIDLDGTQCYVAWKADAVIVAFRGTQPTERVDILNDIDFPRVAWDRPGEEVHEGFRKALDVAWSGVLAEIQRHPDRPVWFTGHSLGAAVATLAADRFLSVTGVLPWLYIIGSPRVGDAAFVGGFNERFSGRAFRYVNHHDVVTELPPEDFGFGEIDAVLHFDGNGHIEKADSSGGLKQVLTHAADDMGNLVGAAFQSGAHFLPDFLTDHTPRRYATLVWNALVESA
jgi:triacylglycerol lipase